MYKHAAYTASLLLPLTGLNMLSLGLFQASGVFDFVLKPGAKISRKILLKHKKILLAWEIFPKKNIVFFTLVVKISRKILKHKNIIRLRKFFPKNFVFLH